MRTTGSAFLRIADLGALLPVRLRPAVPARKQAARYHALSDYTDQEFVHRSQIASENPPIGERGNRICFFPNKGAELAAPFIEQASA